MVKKVGGRRGSEKDEESGMSVSRRKERGRYGEGGVLCPLTLIPTPQTLKACLITLSREPARLSILQAGVKNPAFHFLITSPMPCWPPLPHHHHHHHHHPTLVAVPRRVPRATSLLSLSLSAALSALNPTTLPQLGLRAPLYHSLGHQHLGCAVRFSPSSSSIVVVIANLSHTHMYVSAFLCVCV